MTREQIIKQLHSIREAHYNETKNLSLRNKVAQINQDGEEVIKKYGLKIKSHKRIPE